MTTQISKNSAESSSQKESDSSGKTAAFLAGVVAAMGMTIVMLLLLLFGTTSRSLANLVADKVAAVAGPGISEFFIHAIGPLGKELLFLTVLIAQVGVGGLLGFLFVVINRRNTRPPLIWRNAYIVSTGFWLFFVLLGLPLVDEGWLGSDLGNQQSQTLIVSFFLFELFGYIFGSSYIYLAALSKLETSTIQPVAKNSPRSNRRRFVGIMSAGFVLVVGAAIGLKAFGPSSVLYWTNLGQPQPDGTLEGEVTPTEDFYLVSKNAFNPKVDGAGWQLTLEGLVNSSLSFDLASLGKLPQRTVYHTLTCISNRVGDQFIGNAQWSGVSLKALLEQVGVKSGVKKVMFTCADGYTDSITIEKAMEDNTLIALQMNGQPLTSDHGFPARMLVPNIYGMKNAKWLTSIKLIDTEFEGYWQKQGWNNLATIQTYSLITLPADGALIKSGQPITLRGVAYAGSRQIEKVEFSPDNGQSWQEAPLKERLGPNSWTLWKADWTPAAGVSQDYNLMVRAIETGNIYQNANKQEPFPSGATGYHTIRVKSS